MLDNIHFILFILSNSSSCCRQTPHPGRRAGGELFKMSKSTTTPESYLPGVAGSTTLARHDRMAMFNPRRDAGLGSEP